MLVPNESSATRLLTFDKAGSYGLQRAWFAQVSVDSTRGRMAQWTLHKDQLFSLSTLGSLQAIDCETGATLWTVRVGIPDHPFAGSAVNDQYVAVTNSTRLYVIDREDGHVLASRLLSGAAIGAPALSENYAFVGLINGMIEGYRVDDLAAPVWRYQSSGHIFHSPLVSGNVVSWPTSRDYLYVAQSDQPRVLYRVVTNDEIVAPPAELAPYLYVASRDGYLYRIHELSGAESWKFSTGYPIVKKPAVVGDMTYVASEEPALHAVETKTGRPLWMVAGATQFVAEGVQHVYAMDRSGALLILEKKSGGVVGRLNTAEGDMALVNDQSDRIYLVSDRGLVQCLHEQDSPEPTYYRPKTDTSEEQVKEETEESPFIEAPPAEEFSPPEARDEPKDAFGSPAQPAEEESEEEDDNPFF